MKSNALTLSSPSKYNPTNGRWTVFVPNENIWYMYGLLEEKIFEFQKFNPNHVTRNNYFQYVEVYMYEQVLKRLRSAARGNKNELKLTQTEALGLIKLDANCIAYLSKIVNPF